MATTALRLACFLAVIAIVVGDCYMHNPRGSNNRLKERSANRDNANRLFDSQNNNRGGYNVGDVDDQDAIDDENSDIYYMKFFQSTSLADTSLVIEWTNQHGCGGNEDDDPHKLNCNIVIQYMVMDATEDVSETNAHYRIHDGTETNTQNHQTPNKDESYGSYVSRRDNSVQENRGLHEPFDFYDDCYIRERNLELFTADQNLRSNKNGVSSAIYTRQNPNGNRRGYECPEERDYYPYWHPTPWRDIAVMTSNMSLCDMYQDESFNRKPQFHCRQKFPTGEPKGYSEYNTQEKCEQLDDNGDPRGEWYMEYGYIDIDTDATSEAMCRNRNDSTRANYDGMVRVWYFAKFGDTDMQCLVLPPKPDCTQGGWTRVNHLGNSRDGVPLNYTWTLPYFPSGEAKLAVLRIRYNISTDDYDPWNTTASQNQKLSGQTQRSPVTNNPYINIGSTSNKPLRLAVNTAQFGRTFQDRSHVMMLRPRDDLSNADQLCHIYNLNVRGKRGNIVQVYPAVEYDFVPNRLEIKDTDCVHIQWTGSNTHNNANPGGDGQTGDAGEGRGGTDRSNMLQSLSPNQNYPLPWEHEQVTLFKEAEIVWYHDNTLNLDTSDIAVALASSGYYDCLSGCTNAADTKDPKLNKLLNNAPASFEGVVLRFKKGNYYYLCSRNNNFTNRSQRGHLVVT